MMKNYSLKIKRWQIIFLSLTLGLTLIAHPGFTYFAPTSGSPLYYGKTYSSSPGYSYSTGTGVFGGSGSSSLSGSGLGGVSGLGSSGGYGGSFSGGGLGSFSAKTISGGGFSGLGSAGLGGAGGLGGGLGSPGGLGGTGSFPGFSSLGGGGGLGGLGGSGLGSLGGAGGLGGSVVTPGFGGLISVTPLPTAASALLPSSISPAAVAPAAIINSTSPPLVSALSPFIQPGPIINNIDLPIISAGIVPPPVIYVSPHVTTFQSLGCLGIYAPRDPYNFAVVSNFFRGGIYTGAISNTQGNVTTVTTPQPQALYTPTPPQGVVDLNAIQLNPTLGGILRIIPSPLFSVYGPNGEVISGERAAAVLGTMNLSSGLVQDPALFLLLAQGGLMAGPSFSGIPSSGSFFPFFAPFSPLFCPGFFPFPFGLPLIPMF